MDEPEQHAMGEPEANEPVHAPAEEMAATVVPPPSETVPPISGGPSRHGRRPSIAWIAAATVMGGMVGAGALVVALHVYRPQFLTVPQVQVVAQPLAATTGNDNLAASVYQKVVPAVVLVTNDSNTTGPFGETQSQTDYGSGVIIRSDGYIVTNDHVVAGSTKVTVTLHNGQTYPATIVGQSADTDLAVLKINATNLPTVTFANSNDIVPGEVAIAIGNPLGPQFADTVTQGIVSAMRPLLYPPDASEQRITEMVQTDAPINPGNSGGPLLNAQGQVIGINSMKITEAETSVSASGLGFAIPSNTVVEVANDLMRYGYLPQAYIGIQLQASPASALTNQAQTITIEGVEADSPASHAGLQTGEVITGWNGHRVLNYYQLVVDINAARPGQRITLDVAKGGNILQVPVTLGLQKTSTISRQSSSSVEPSPLPIPLPIFP
jgi:serine protease Do